MYMEPMYHCKKCDVAWGISWGSPNKECWNCGQSNDTETSITNPYTGAIIPYPHVAYFVPGTGDFE
jgi:hypothetical protein